MFVNSNDLPALLPYYKEKLKTLYDEKEIENIFHYMVFFVFGLSKIEIRTGNRRLSESELLTQRNIVKRLLNSEPIQHITGLVEFYDCILKVNKDTLIPRPETEELVDLIIQNHSKNKLKILDIGTGSGCIPIVLKKNRPEWIVSAMDVSKNALLIANKNALDHQVDIDFIEDNILSSTHNFATPFDLIVSNPPYVLASDKAKMAENVLKFDPHLALFVDDEDPLLFYRAILNYCEKNLSKNGWVYFEIHETFGKETKELLSKYNFKSVRVIKDLQGKDRMVLGQK